MADKTRNTFPTIPGKHWWLLRSKFKQSIPSAVTANYLATALKLSVSSARTNVMPSLSMLGLVDDDGKPTDLARKWRDDHEYPAVCGQILKIVYPSELLEAAPPPSPDRQAVMRWFANSTGVGQSAATRMAVVYDILAEANPAGATREPATKNSGSRPPSPKAKPAARRSSPAKPLPEQPAAAQGSGAGSQLTGRGVTPEIHVNVQIHIAADASAEQIEQIFASMGKHLVKMGPHATGN